MNCLGIIVGLATFIIIGIFHPLVIKAEYHLGKRCWWMFALAGVAFAVLSLFIKSKEKITYFNPATKALSCSLI